MKIYTKVALIWMLSSILGATAWAQFTFTESFKNSTAPGWTSFQQGSGPAARLTAGATATTGDPEVGTIDVEGDGWLRLTNETNQQSNGYVLDTAIPAVDNTIFVEFEVAMWSTKSTAADGITFFMFDAAEAFQPGATGGSMAYAQKIESQGGESDMPGVPGGYLAVGIDNYGNFSNPTEGREGGPGFLPNSVAVRGQGEITIGGPLDGGWYDGYDYLGGTGGTNTTVGGNPAIAALTTNLDFLNQASRPDTDGADHRSFQIELNELNELIVRMKVGATGSFVELFTLENLPTRPEELRIGFSGGTGGLNEVLELRNVSTSTQGGSTTWVWDAGAGGSSLNQWGRGGSRQNNWDKNTNPTTISGVTPTVVFDDQYVTSNKTITVRNNADTVVKNMFFSGEYSYVLNPQSSSKNIIFDAGAGGTSSTLAILNSPNGNANHELNVNITLNNTLELNHYVTGTTFTLGRNVSLGNNLLDVNTFGDTVIEGDISGTGGDIFKTGPGTLTLMGNNTFTGTVTVDEGALHVNGSGRDRALGNITELVVNTGGSVIFDDDNEINNSANVTLNGGTFNTGGFAQTVATMTFTTGSVIVLGGDTLTLSDLVGTGGILAVSGYTFDGQLTAAPGSVDQNTLNSIYFADQGILGAIQLPNGDIVPTPVPEPSTYAVGAAIVLIVGVDLYRRYKRKTLNEGEVDTL